jgi:hypothetical protein
MNSESPNVYGPFVEAPFISRSFWDAVLLRDNPDNAYIELINALSRTENVCTIPADFADSLNSKFRTNLHARHREKLDRLYAEFLRHCLSDKAFSEKEVKEIHRLRRLFLISDAKNASIYNASVGEAYRRAVQRVIADGKVSDEERKELDELAPSLHITDAVKNEIYKDEIGKMIQGRLDLAVSDRMLSPQEDRELQELASGLGAELTQSSNTTRALNTFRMLWRIRYGDMPLFDPGINLQRGEVCYLSRNVEWYEMRRQRVGVGYAGPAMSIKIADGVYWKTGAFGVKPMTRDALVKIDAGQALITNKRLLFMGSLKNTNIKLDKILDVTKYSDGVGIEKDSGKSPVLSFDQDIDIFCATLARAISDFAAA